MGRQSVFVRGFNEEETETQVSLWSSCDRATLPSVQLEQRNANPPRVGWQGLILSMREGSLDERLYIMIKEYLNSPLINV